ncbi:MAG: hypothetical protein ACREEL_11265 [Stellaceae bacterium]
MPHTFARAVLASVIAFGTLVLSTGSAVPADYDQGRYSYTAPLPPIIVPDAQRDGRTIVIVREPPSLLTPADLHFSVEQKNGVTVVRGPLAH